MVQNDTEKLNNMLDALEHYEALYVIRRITKDNDALIKKTIKIVEGLLSDVVPEEVAEDLYYELNSIDVEDLWNSSGKTRYGYVDPDEKAWEMFVEVVEPFMDKMKKSNELNMPLAAKNYCLGILQGLRKYSNCATSEFADWVVDVPYDYMDTVLIEWKKGNPTQEDLEEVGSQLGQQG